MRFAHRVKSRLRLSSLNCIESINIDWVSKHYTQIEASILVEYICWSSMSSQTTYSVPSFRVNFKSVEPVNCSLVLSGKGGTGSGANYPRTSFHFVVLGQSFFFYFLFFWHWAKGADCALRTRFGTGKCNGPQKRVRGPSNLVSNAIKLSCELSSTYCQIIFHAADVDKYEIICSEWSAERSVGRHWLLLLVSDSS